MNDDHTINMIVATLSVAALEFQRGYRPATLEKFIEVASEAYRLVAEHEAKSNAAR